MVRWCIRLTRLTLVCEVIRYRLVQVRQNQKKNHTDTEKRDNYMGSTRKDYPREKCSHSRLCSECLQIELCQGGLRFWAFSETRASYRWPELDSQLSITAQKYNQALHHPPKLAAHMPDMFHFSIMHLEFPFSIIHQCQCQVSLINVSALFPVHSYRQLCDKFGAGALHFFFHLNSIFSYILVAYCRFV